MRIKLKNILLRLSKVKNDVTFAHLPCWTAGPTPAYSIFYHVPKPAMQMVPFVNRKEISLHWWWWVLVLEDIYNLLESRHHLNACKVVAIRSKNIPHK